MSPPRCPCLLALAHPLLLLLLVPDGSLSGQALTFTRYSGNAAGSGYEDGTGPDARLSYPGGLALDPAGNLLLTEGGNNTIRVISPAGQVTTLAGAAGQWGTRDGRRGAARLWFPQGIARAPDGGFYFADSYGQTIRHLSAEGVVRTVAGRGGISGSLDGTGAQARFRLPQGLGVHPVSGDVYVVDSQNETIRKVTAAGVVTTYAGAAGQAGAVDGVGGDARFSFGGDGAVVVAPDGTLFVADSRNHAIRRVAPDGTVTTFAGSLGESGHVDGLGTGARFAFPSHIDRDVAGNLYVSEAWAYCIRKITPGGLVSTVAGTPFASGVADGTGPAARFRFPDALVVDPEGNLFVADFRAATIRRITPQGDVTTLCGAAGVAGAVDGPAAGALFSGPHGLSADAAGNLYVADRGNQLIRRIAPGDLVSTVAGLPSSQGSADGVGSAARFRQPVGLAAMADGTLFVTDHGNHTIRRIAPTGEVTTLAGLAQASGSQDGAGAAARFNNPWGVAVDATGRAFVTDWRNHTIRQVEPDGTVTTLAGLAGQAGDADGPALSARFRYPAGIAVDASGTVFVADSGNNTIRKLSGGVVSTLAGAALQPGRDDGVGAAARLDGPTGLTLEAEGSLLFTEIWNQSVRRVTPAGVVTTLAGGTGRRGNVEGAFDGPVGVARIGPLYFVSNDTSSSILVGRTALPDAATIDQAQGLVSEVRTLSSTAGAASAWTWKVVRRPTGSLAALSQTQAKTATFTPDLADLYELRLRASSGSASATTIVSLQACAGVPSATITAASEVCTSSGANAASVADAGEGAVYAWTATGVTLDEPAEGPAVTFSAGAAGPALLQVVVTLDGCASTGSRSILVREGGAPPVVTPPSPATLSVNQTDCAGGGGTSLASLASRFADQYLTLDAFLNLLATASDDCGIATRLPSRCGAGEDVTATTLFPVGPNPVTFCFTDPFSQVGTASGTVHVRRQGDLDLSGTVDVLDVVTLAAHIVGNAPAGSPPFLTIRSVADGNSDGVIDVFDLVLIQNFVVGNIACLTP